jgi:alcohol dehydrogenase
LRAFGVQEGDLEALTEDALTVTRLASAFPVPDVARTYREIVRNAFRGRLSGVPASALAA